MEVIHTLVIDFARPYKTNTILITQGDDRSRKCRFVLMNNGKKFDMSDVVTATVKAKQPATTNDDGETVNGVAYGVADITEDDYGDPINEITYVLPLGITGTSGKTTMNIELFDNDGKSITSFDFYLNIRGELYSEDDYADEDSLSGFRDLLARAGAAIDKVEAMTEAERLPNPYSLYLKIRNQTYEYSGVAAVDGVFDEVMYMGTRSKNTSDIDWSKVG